MKGVLIGEPVLIRPFARLIKDYPDGVNLTTGEPTVKINRIIKKSTKKYIKDKFLKYSNPFGNELLREQIANQYGNNYSKDNVLVTNGATQALFFCLMEIITSTNDEVIIVEPVYPQYKPLIEKLNGKAIIYDISETEINLSVSEIEKLITKNTKAIILNEPNNPLGYISERDVKDKIVEIAFKNDIYLIIDETYRDYNFSNNNLFSEIDYNYDKLIFIYTMSKSYAITGYRIGFIIGGIDIINRIKNDLPLINSCLPQFTQLASLTALQNKKINHRMNLRFKENLQLLKNFFNVWNIKYIEPQGGFYIFIEIGTLYDVLKNKDVNPKVIENYLNSINENGYSVEQIQNNIKDYFSEDIIVCLKLASVIHVAAVPGVIFGKNFKNYIRISYCHPKKLIKQLILKMNFIYETLY